MVKAARTKEGGRFQVGFLGGGNMAEAIVRGLISAGEDAGTIAVAEPVAARRRLLARRFGVAVLEDNLELAKRSRTIVLAVKPQVVDAVLDGVSDAVGARQVLVSIAAGVTTKRMERRLGAGARVVRVMPNTPCLVGKGASVLCAGSLATRADIARARRLFAAVGDVHVVESERLLDPVTGLSGSGPAYVYLFAEALIRGGKSAGLDAELASKLAYQTIAGAAEMLIATGTPPADLRRAVSSPGGTTLAGLARLAEGGFERTVAEAVKTATRRSRELGRGK